MIDRQVTKNHFHVYLNPDRLVDEGAIQVHGITNEFLVDKQRFAQVAEAFVQFVAGTELLIHNAAFDVGFINHELQRLAESGGPDLGPIERHCQITDTLKLAREKHPGQRNSLDALCRRYEVDNTGRTLHGALLDSQLLAEVYLALTGGQLSMDLTAPALGAEAAADGQASTQAWQPPETRVLRATAAELQAHEARLRQIQEKSGSCLWLESTQSAD
jgi:DNA polymerase-3 subunit epsilon